MANDYLWDRSGVPEPDTKDLEDLLAPITHDAPLDELRGRRGIARATAHEPAPPRKKGKMNIFDKRIIGMTAFTAAACGLLGIAMLHRSDPKPPPPAIEPISEPSVHATPTYLNTLHLAPVAPTTNADLAITAGESVWVHTTSGVAVVEIQSRCDAEVVMKMTSKIPNADAQDLLESLGVLVATTSAGGRTSRFQLGAEDLSGGAFEYTSQCVNQPLVRGRIDIDRADAREAILPTSNARVFANELYSFDDENEGFHVFGTVLPGAQVFIGAKQLALEPVELAEKDPPLGLGFSTDTPYSPERMTTSVRVDDAKGTHFYVVHATVVLTASCARSMRVPRDTAAVLDAKGDHTGAFTAIKTAMKYCQPDRSTLSLALLYACKAGDADAAQTYMHQLPEELRDVPDCARQGILFDAK